MQLSDFCQQDLPVLLGAFQHCFASISTLSLANLDRVWQHKRHESIHGNDPRRDGCAKALAQEGAQGDVFPLLDVAS